MSDDVRTRVEQQLAVLRELRSALSNESYYRGLIIITCDYARAGMRQDVLSMLALIPVNYFQLAFRRHAREDANFLGMAELIAYEVLNFHQEGNHGSN